MISTMNFPQKISLSDFILVCFYAGLIPQRDARHLLLAALHTNTDKLILTKSLSSPHDLPSTNGPDFSIVVEE